MKNNTTKFKYLKVRFYDNDFGLPVKEALKRLWGYIHENNNHLVESLPWIFRKLHTEIKLIIKMII